MGKKKKQGNPAADRMNFLFQAAHTVPLLSSESISRVLVDAMRQTGARTVSSMNPSIKRSFCKGCSTLLIPGVTCTHRIRRKNVVISCTQCQSISRRARKQKTNETPKLPKAKRNKKHKIKMPISK